MKILQDLVNSMCQPVQEYWMPHNGDGSLERARPAQLVYKDNISDLVVGFLSEVDAYGFTICLFEAVEYDALPPLARPRTGKQDMDWVAERLQSALLGNPGMREYWAKAINGETVTQDGKLS